MANTKTRLPNDTVQFSTHISSVEPENFDSAASFMQYGIETLGLNDGLGSLSIL
ncbi:MAG: hypothetical protein ACJZ1S_03175 [Candidatus Neomarinimicrobiota bacterium]